MKGESVYYDNDYTTEQVHPLAKLTEDQVQQIYNYAVETRQLVRELQAEVTTLKAALREPQSPMEAFAMDAFAKNREQDYEEGISR